MRTRLFAAACAAAVVCLPSARADLINAFSGFDAAWEVGVSGLRSSYHADTRAGQPTSGSTTGSFLHDLGPARVRYPGGVGEAPSPGGNLGRHFDQGVLGIKVDDGSLVVKLASGLDPREGFYFGGWNTWYGQGDVFLTVKDSSGISRFGLLNAWPRDEQGNPRALNGGHFRAARAFHVSGGTGGTSLEGHVARLNGDADVALSGGRGSYGPRHAPPGLDLRAFVQGGTDLGPADFTLESLRDFGQTWYVQTWTVDLGTLSADPAFDVALHAGATCANDQIGMGPRSIPEPSGAVLGLLGLGCVGTIRRRFG